MKVFSNSLILLYTTCAFLGSCAAFVPAPPLVRQCQLSHSNNHRRHHCYQESDEAEDTDGNMMHRRSFFHEVSRYSVASSLASAILPFCAPANARGLVQFPCKSPLFNTYHMMRAGTTLLEEDDIISTNPLFLTNREAGLSDTGIAQVQAACKLLEGKDPSVIKYSLAASSMDTTAIIKDQLKFVRVIPEFTFMDPRAIGKWDMMSYSATVPAIAALDEAEAGTEGRGGRPPANDDGTPNETLADQAVRLVQLLSVLETQYSGDTILLVFPDGTSPALLSCMMAGIPFNKVHELEFEPGEIRVDVTMTSVLELYQMKHSDSIEEYKKKIEKGKVELERLRSLKSDDIISRKDMLIEKERMEIEAQQRRKEEERLLLEEKKSKARNQRLQEMEASRQRQYDPSDPDSKSINRILSLAAGSVTAAAAALISGVNREYKESIMDKKEKSAIPKDPVTNSTIEARDFSKIPQTLPTSNDTLYPQGVVLSPRPTLEDKQKAAEVAMKDYLEQDDGGEDFLISLGQIMQEDDTDVGDEWLMAMGEIMEEDDTDDDDKPFNIE